MPLPISCYMQCCRFAYTIQTLAQQLNTCNNSPHKNRQTLFLRPQRLIQHVAVKNNSFDRYIQRPSRPTKITYTPAITPLSGPPQPSQDTHDPGVTNVESLHSTRLLRCIRQCYHVYVVSTGCVLPDLWYKSRAGSQHER